MLSSLTRTRSLVRAAAVLGALTCAVSVTYAGALISAVSVTRAATLI